ncbi:MAG: Ig-like domain-containing protein, partial [Gemmatimonadaceae bacterium]|nr:Ig-like domain-containing protein [Gemmatimonadaceae bacterium]
MIMRLLRSCPSVAVLAFSIVAVACGGGGGTDANPVGPPTAVSALSGSSATVTAGSTAPIALVAKVLDAGGHAVPGATVTWGTSSGSISPATATTDGSGQSTAQWAPGKVAGSQSATASVSGAGAATFTATVTAGPLAKIKLTPDTIKLAAAGTTAQLSAVGLDAFDNNVTEFNPIYTIDD